MTDNILIVGSGAIGGFYGGLLAKAGAQVSVVCRSDYDHVKQHGIQIDSALLGQWHFQPQQILLNSGDYQGTIDYLILCTKVTADIDRAALLKPAVSKNTVIVFIQNGIDIEDEIVRAFPENEIISGLAFICCNRVASGIIKHLAYGRLTLGNLPVGITTKAEHLQQLFLSAGIETVCSENIIADRWRKCIWNAPFNPLSVLSGGLATLTMLEQQENFIRRIMQEVYDIASALGLKLPEDIIDTNIANTYAMPPYKTSMLLDFERHHAMETEAILGNTVRAGHRAGVSCPTLEALYALMQLIQIKNYSDKNS